MIQMVAPFQPRDLTHGGLLPGVVFNAVAIQAWQSTRAAQQES